MPSSSHSKEGAITGDGIVNLTIDNLSSSGVGRGLLTRLTNNPRPNDQIIGAWNDQIIRDWAEVLKKSGVLPPGELGDLIVQEIANELTKMLEALAESLQDLSAGSDIDGVVSVFGRNHPVRVENVNEFALVRVRYKRFNDSLILGPWIELALLTLISNGAKYVAHFVARAVKDVKPVVFRKFELKGATNRDRLNSAILILACYEGMYRAASNGPIPFFEQASHELHKKDSARHKVLKKLKNDLDYSAASRYFFGDIDPEDIFNETALKQDYLDLNRPPVDPITSRAQLFSDHVWHTFDRTTNVLEASGGDTTDSGSDDE